MVHWFRWFTGSCSSLVHVVHRFTSFTGSGGSLARVYNNAMVASNYAW